MIGWWETKVPIIPKCVTNCTGVIPGRDTKATAYVKVGDQTLISVANFGFADMSITFQIDWAAIGQKSENAVLYAPPIENFQEKRTWSPGDVVSVPAQMGWLIVIKSS